MTMSIISKIKNIVLVAGVVAGMAAFAVPAPAGAIDLFSDACKNDPDLEICEVKDDTNEDLNSFIIKVINALYYVLAVAAVLVIVISGAIYVMSNGDSNLITAAKNRILYAVIGLIVASLAWAMVSFVVNKLA